MTKLTRRNIVLSSGIVISAGLSGCVDDSTSEPEPDPDPETNPLEGIPHKDDVRDELSYNEYYAATTMNRNEDTAEIQLITRHAVDSVWVDDSFTQDLTYSNDSSEDISEIIADRDIGSSNPNQYLYVKTVYESEGDNHFRGTGTTVTIDLENITERGTLGVIVEVQNQKVIYQNHIINRDS